MMVPPDRRHEDDPHPPDGTPERRCSDTQCMTARNEWFLNELLPKLTIRFWGGIVITIGACASAFFFLSRSAITEHQVEALRVFVTKETYLEDKRSLENKLDVLASYQRTIIDRLDRNLDQIKDTRK